MIQPYVSGNETCAQNSLASNPQPIITNPLNMPIDQNTGKRRQATETEFITVIEKHADGKIPSKSPENSLFQNLRHRAS